MRLQFQERPWDLVLIAALTATLSVILLVAGVGNIAAIFLFLFAPGYMFAAVVFPGPQGIGWTERLALSVGLSLAFVPMVALLLSFTPFGISVSSLVGGISLFTLGLAAVALWRRMGLPANERLRFAADLAWPEWSGQGSVERAVTIGLAASVVFAGAALAYVLFVPRSGNTYTEFFLLGPNGTAEDYPERLNVSEPAAVTIVVVNHEAANVSYVVRVDLVGVRTVFNGTTGRNETIEVNRTSWGSFSIALNDGESWVQAYPFAINDAGHWRIDFYLFRNPDLLTTYRDLRLVLVVGGP